MPSATCMPRLVIASGVVSCIMRGMTRNHPTSILRRMLGLYVLMLLIFLATGVAIFVQAGRSDPQPADAAVVMLSGDQVDNAARVERARQLFVNGGVARIVLVGENPAAARDLLRGRISDDAVLEVRAATQVTQLAAVRQALDGHQLRSMLLLSEPVETLRLLKVARDAGLQPYSMPVAANTQLGLFDTLGEIVRYFRYVLFFQ